MADEPSTNVSEKTALASEAAKPQRIKGEQKSSKQAVVRYDDDLGILFDKPLPDYDIGRNKAYAAVSNGSVKGGLYAVVCERFFVPRRQAASKYITITNPALPQLIDYGRVYWEPAGQERFVFIYRDVLGKPLAPRGHKNAIGMRQETVMDAVVTPMISVLKNFRDKDFFHGGINPFNLFDGGVPVKELKGVFLGDGLSVPASYAQPILYETIERAMTDPIGRGKGSFADDLYSFGVTIAVLMRTQDPFEGKDADFIIREKMRLGSYAAITGKERFKGRVLELLRGLLHDDPEQRWTIDEVLVWQDGRRITPKQAVKKKIAARPFVFSGEKFVQAPLLATSLDIIPSETMKVVEDGSLLQWLERSLEDDEAVELVEEAVKVTKDASRGSADADLMVANLCSALDTNAPIRFKGLRLMGSGIGTALHEVIVLKQDFKGFVNLFTQGVAMNWVTATALPNLDKAGLITKYNSCRNYLKNKKTGFGIERCLYLLSDEAPCLSPKFINHLVFKPEDILRAYNDLCRKDDAPHGFVDRHVAAFLGVYDHKCIEGFILDIGSSIGHRKILGELKCLAAIQKRYGIKAVPHLAQEMNERLQVVLKRYRDHKVREKIENGLKKYADVGDLPRMLSLVDNPEVIAKDSRAFKAALGEYAALSKEKDVLEDQIENNRQFGYARGADKAAFVCGVIAAFAIVMTVFMFFTQNGGLKGGF
ncbi:MAG: hypothetical protein ACRBCT_02530 [Alphaproteobacteria bacterium]